MGSDRARVSFDAGRHWRGVVAQQGRVMLEADVNEAEAIAAEESRAQLRELVGPIGTTPDDGYRILPPSGTQAAGDFTVQHGAIYVGGVRVSLDADMPIGKQPDWVDAPNEPAAAPVPQPGKQYELVYLLLREHEVSAVEDPALVEAALGGPDTAARTRILQRVLRTSVASATWPTAWAETAGGWASMGYVPNAATMRLESTARLHAFFTAAPPPSACQPEAQGGYLGAENQLIRVTISAIDDAGTPTLMWGYDNASALYRVTIPPSGTAQAGATTLILATMPVDAQHQPRPGQAVEILRTAAVLDAQAAVASATGIPATIAPNGGYDPDKGSVVVATDLTDNATASSPVLFLRVWQDKVAAPPGTPVLLGDTGVQVSLTSSDGQNHFHVGDYWTLAVRPSTPEKVYPQRIADTPQPPDGPPLWACPLGLVHWTSPTTPAVIDDPRGPFATLVQLTRAGGCCTVSVSPDEVTGDGLQKLVDSFAGKGPVTICLRPGTYFLPAPLVLGPDNGGLTLEGQPGGTILKPDPTAGSQTFLEGLVLVNGADSVELRGLRLELPSATWSIQSVLPTLLPPTQTLAQLVLGTLSLSFGVHAVDATRLTLADCTLVYPSATTSVLAAGIFADTHLEGLRVDRCHFVGLSGGAPSTMPFADLSAGNSTTPPYPLLFGVLQVPVTAPAGTTSTPVVTLPASPPDPGGTFTQPDLSDAYLTGNLFEGLTVPLLVIGQLATIAVTDNTARSCYGGFWLVSYLANESLLQIFEELDQVHYYPGTVDDLVFVLAMIVGRSLTYSAPPTSRFRPAQTAAPRQQTEIGSVAAAGPTRIALPIRVDFPVGAPPPSDYTVPPLDPGPRPSARVEFSNNQIDATLPMSYTGAALMVLNLVDPTGSVIVNGNRFRCRAPRGPAAFLYGGAQCAITGNVISNEAEKTAAGVTPVVTPASLRISVVPALAVTGNVFVGPTVLEARRFNPPLGQSAPTDPFLASWDFLNTVLPPVTPPMPATVQGS